MRQEERLDYLIGYLLNEMPAYKMVQPKQTADKKALFRALCNLRPPMSADSAFLTIQDGYLQEELKRKDVVDILDLCPARGSLYLWKGDITTLRADAIVNAANRELLGCFIPHHGCVDNAIHSAAGIQLRLACQRIMEKQGGLEPAGQAKITPAFNLPCRYVLHTVGPVISSRVTEVDCDLLASCYRSCLKLAEATGITSIAFCCISTGEFHFPNELAAETAVRTVEAYLKQSRSKIKVIFNVFQKEDESIYRRLLE